MLTLFFVWILKVVMYYYINWCMRLTYTNSRAQSVTEVFGQFLYSNYITKVGFFLFKTIHIPKMYICWLFCCHFQEKSFHEKMWMYFASNCSLGNCTMSYQIIFWHKYAFTFPCGKNVPVFSCLWKAAFQNLLQAGRVVFR
jgi:hypothetical protein